MDNFAGHINFSVLLVLGGSTRADVFLLRQAIKIRKNRYKSTDFLQIQRRGRYFGM
jgi:hypothetical protein